MATSEESKYPISSNPTIKEKGGEEELQNGEEDEEEETEEEEEEEEEEDEDEENESKRGEEERLISERTKLNNLVRRLSSERVFLRVHDIVIKGNTKTKDFLIEAEFDALKSATSMRELIQAAAVANARLQHLDIFDSVNVTLDAGPPELPGTTNVIVEVVETHNPLTGDIGVFSKPEVKSSPPSFFGFCLFAFGCWGWSCVVFDGRTSPGSDVVSDFGVWMDESSLFNYCIQDAGDLGSFSMYPGW